jgi:hypothetical protein
MMSTARTQQAFLFTGSIIAAVALSGLGSTTTAAAAATARPCQNDIAVGIDYHAPTAAPKDVGWITLTNKGSRKCTILGFPQVRQLTRLKAIKLPAQTSYQKSDGDEVKKVKPVTLAPGGIAYSLFFPLPAKDCENLPLKALEVIVPGATKTARVTTKSTKICTNSAEQQSTVFLISKKKMTIGF